MLQFIRRSSPLAVALLLLPALAAAQETPTERDAARDVLKKMAALEQSLDVPGWVSKLAGTPNPARDQVVARAKELMDKELLAMADDIATHPEIGFEETRSVKILTDYLKAHDFDVRDGRRAGSTPRSSRNTGRTTAAPTLGVILEYDALRGTQGAFHGDQHSAQGPVGMAAAIAMAEYLDADPLARQRHRLRHARRRDDAAEREDGDARGARLRRRRHHRPQPLRRCRRRGRRRASAPAA